MSASMFKFPPIGMGPNVWGPIFWNTMHIASLGYSMNPTNEEKEAASAFFSSLQFMIPCPICKEHYSYFLKNMPVVTTDRDTLINWVFDLHNKVNVQLGKSPVTFDQYIKNMQKLSEKESIDLYNNNNNNILKYMGGGTILLFGAWYMYKQGIFNIKK